MYCSLSYALKSARPLEPDFSWSWSNNIGPQADWRKVVGLPSSGDIPIYKYLPVKGNCLEYVLFDNFLLWEEQLTAVQLLGLGGKLGFTSVARLPENVLASYVQILLSDLCQNSPVHNCHFLKICLLCLPGKQRNGSFQEFIFNVWRLSVKLDNSEELDESKAVCQVVLPCWPPS